MFLTESVTVQLLFSTPANMNIYDFLQTDDEQTQHSVTGISNIKCVSAERDNNSNLLQRNVSENGLVWLVCTFWQVVSKVLLCLFLQLPPGV